jgi:WD40 repeat protein
LPNRPYRYLDWYHREDAELFFGRGAAIRRLFTLVTAQSEPIILFYGQSGVGKSSLLAAGLLPRLEQSHTVVYLRRDQASGLLGTLTTAPSPLVADEPGLGWRRLEQEAGKPLLIILDQLEELYTRPNHDRPDEMAQFLEALLPVFADLNQRPQGKLILSFRKEFLAEIKDALEQAKLPMAPVFLEKLDRLSIIDVVTGPARVERLRRRYGLTVEDGLAALIADDLLEDPGSAIAPTLQILLARMWEEAQRRNNSQPRFDQELYLAMKHEGLALGHFLDSQVTELASARADAVASGLVWDLLFFHTTALGTSEERSEEALLHMYPHVTEPLPALVQQCKDLYLLVDPAKDQLELKRASRLAHDALAPIVRTRFNDSEAPGQRARRILENRAPEWEKLVAGTTAPPLSRDDLATVEAGQQGMRAWTEPETSLIAASRQARANQERQDKRRRTTTWGFIGITVVLVALALWLSAARRAATERQQLAEDAAATESVLRATAEAATTAEAELRTQAEGARDAEAAAREEADQLRARAEVAREQENLITRAQAPMDQEPFDPSLALLLSLEAVDLTWSRYRTVGANADWNLQQMMAEAQNTGWRLSLPRHVHTGEIYAAVFSPDGTMLLTASDDQTARLWDVATGQQVLMLVGHTGAVRDAQFSPDGNLIATVGQDGTVRLWDPATASQLARWQAHGNNRVRTLAFSPAGDRIVTAGQDGAARVWDVATGNEAFEFRHEGDWVLSATFSPDGTMIVTTGNDETARIWDAETGDPMATLSADSWVRDAAFSPDNRRLVAAIQDGSVRVWEVATWTKQDEFPPHTGDNVQANTIAFDDGGTLAVTTSSNGQVFVRDSVTGTVLHRLEGHNESVLAAHFSPDGSLLVTASEDYKVRLWEVASGTLLRTIGGRIEPVVIPGVDTDTDQARAVAFHPDGAVVASGGEDNLVHLWDVGAGTEIQTLAAHTDTVRSIAFSPTGDRIATGSEDSSVRLWDGITGEPLRKLTGYTATVTSVAFSPDGNRLVAAGDPHTVLVWNLQNSGEVQALVGHTDTVRSALFSPNGQTILTASDDGTARLWNSQTGQELLRPFRGHTREVTAASFSPDGQRMATAGRDGLVILWELAGGRQLLEFQAHTGGVDAVSFSRDGLVLLTAGRDHSAKLWDAATGRELRRLTGHGGIVFVALFSPDGQTVATTSADGSARLWDVNPRMKQRVFTGHNGLVRYAAFSPDDRWVVSAGEDRQPRLWDVATGRSLRRFIGHEEAVWSAEFSPDGDTLLTASPDGDIRFWNPLTGRSLMTVTVNPDADEEHRSVTFAGFNPRGTLFVTAGSDYLLRLWDAETVTVTKVLSGHSQPVLAAAFSPDGRLLASSSADGSARLWEVASGRELRRLLGHNDWVWFVSFSPDGSRIVTAGGDGTARLWNATTGELQAILSGHSGLVRSAQFSPDGTTLVTAGEDRTIRLWDVATGCEVRQFIGHNLEVWYAGFSHDGRTLVSAGFDNTVRLWDARLEDTLAHARALIQRDPPLFTQEERDRYAIGEPFLGEPIIESCLAATATSS